MSNRLREILDHKRTEIARLNLAAEQARAADAPAPRDFLAAVTRPPEAAPRLIAELKRASPSRGVLAAHLDLFQIARLYAGNGAAAVSVLTDERFFLGELATLRALRFEHAFPRPLLRKDFLLAPVQLYEARAAGADAILLIVAALEDAALQDLHALALALGLTALVEVHTAAETERALRIPGVRLIGVNNRDLTTFDITLETTARLRPLIPAGVTVVSESGLFTAAHVRQVGALGVDAVLVGEALVTAPDIAGKVRELAGTGSATEMPRHGA
ncbi:MAG: indole-3-glycerol phosphate synthase TrpC [Anaerolineales bacterium]|nr:indole-3-glycerol phosphate synthase TrpC [Anaerolineales bacterium]